MMADDANVIAHRVMGVIKRWMNNSACSSNLGQLPFLERIVLESLLQ